jgi:hypothetical protein
LGKIWRCQENIDSVKAYEEHRSAGGNNQLLSTASYVMIFVLPTKFRNRKEVFALSSFISFLIAVTANVVAYFICKWLDGGGKGDK